VARRLLPFVFFLYIVSYLDRANVAFAKLSMSADLHFSEAVFGLGAGLFFVGYLLFQIPGTLLVERHSASKWIGSLAVIWGLCALATGFIHNARQFYCARFILGVAEAGFFPGIICYLAHWFPARDRARAASGFIVAVPLSIALGAPVSTVALKSPCFGLEGWRWMFIAEGLPAIVLGVVTFFYLTDRPSDAAWLSPQERSWLCDELNKETSAGAQVRARTCLAALLDWRVLSLALALLLVVMGGYGFLFWLPTLIRDSAGISAAGATLWSAVPFLGGALAVLALGWSSDRWRERRYHAALPMLLAGLFFLGSAIPNQRFPAIMAWLTLTGTMVYAWAPAFWTTPSSFLSGSAAALATAFINAVGNAGGFLGPSLTGYLLVHEWSFAKVSTLLACFFCAAAVLVYWAGRPALLGSAERRQAPRIPNR